MLGIALVVIEVVYGFHGGIGRYIEGMRLVNGDHDPNYLTYLGGHLRYRFEDYFAVAYLLKEPIAALVLAGLGIVLLIRSREIGILAKLFLVLPPVVLFTIHTMFADGLGIRYIIGVLPFTCLAGGLALAWLVRSGSIAKRCAAGVLCAWSIVAAAGIYPDQLSYFNELACIDDPGKIGLDGGSRCGPMLAGRQQCGLGPGIEAAERLAGCKRQRAAGQAGVFWIISARGLRTAAAEPEPEFDGPDASAGAGAVCGEHTHVRPHERHDRTIPPGLGLDANYRAAGDRGARLLHLRYTVSRTTCFC